MGCCPTRQQHTKVFCIEKENWKWAKRFHCKSPGLRPGFLSTGVTAAVLNFEGTQAELKEESIILENKCEHECVYWQEIEMSLKSTLANHQDTQLCFQREEGRKALQFKDLKSRHLVSLLSPKTSNCDTLNLKYTCLLGRIN